MTEEEKNGVCCRLTELMSQQYCRSSGADLVNTRLCALFECHCIYCKQVTHNLYSL